MEVEADNKRGLGANFADYRGRMPGVDVPALNEIGGPDKVTNYSGSAISGIRISHQADDFCYESMAYKMARLYNTGVVAASVFIHVPPMPAKADVNQLVAKILGAIGPSGDWDGDGIPNGLDDDPFSYGNPCH